MAGVRSGNLYTSTDSGVTWTARASSLDWRSVASSADGTKLVAVVEISGKIYTSTDAGTNWTARASDQWWRSVASSSDGTKLVAAVLDGQLYTSTDAGTNWMARASDQSWYSVASSADGTKLVAAVWGGQIYTSVGALPVITYTAPANGTDSFTFQVQDDSAADNLDLSPNTLTFNVPKTDQTITFPAIGNKLTTDTVGLSATATSGLPVTFTTNGGPAVITGGTNLTFTGAGTVSIVASQAGDGSWNPAPTVTNIFQVCALSANSGPSAGGNSLTLTNGNFGAITNVLVGGVQATITGQGANWVTITIPPTGSDGVKDIVIQTSDNGDITLAGAYTVNPAGLIWDNGLVPGGPYLSAGRYHSLGLKADGTVVAWGSNPNVDSGQAIVPTPNSNFVAVEAGGYHSLGLKADGTVVAWGRSSERQTDVPAPNSDFVAMAAGDWHSLGLKADGTVVAWGAFNINAGQTTVPAPNRDFVAVAAGGIHSLGLKADGSVVAWGDNGWGQTEVPTPNSNFVAVAAGTSHSLGLKSDGTIVAWGRTNEFQTTVPAPNRDFVAVAAGMNHSLGLKADGTVVAWGENMNGQTDVPAPNRDFVAVSAGDHHSVGLKADGTVVAWGWNYYSQTDVPAPNADFGKFSYGVAPDRGLWSGGYPVVISGTNLCNGTLGDVEDVTLCGVSATSIDSVSGSTQIVVTAAAGTPGIGDVQVVSSSHGTTSKADAFEYLRATQAPLVFEPASPQSYATTNALSTTGGSGTGTVSYVVISGPGTIVGGTNLLVTAGSGTIKIVATQAQDDLYFSTAVTSTVTAAKAAQTITFPNPGDQLVTNTVGLTASATSGLTVGFAVGFGPAIVDGTSLTFTGAGRIDIVASQPGNDDYDAALDITNTISVVGIVTNLTPSVGVSDGNTAVRIDGLWLGNGSNITNVTLCGVQATVVSQAVNSVWVTTGSTNITEALTGNVRVFSAFGEAVLSNGYTYFALDPPMALAPTQVMTDTFRANWSVVSNAASYVIDVSTTSNFTSFVTGYANQNVGDTAGTWITGLADNTWYWYRIRSVTAGGSQSLNSNVIGVPTGIDTPWIAVSNMNGSASSGGTQELALDLIFAGAGLTYAVTSDAPAVASAVIDMTTGVLRLTYGDPGTATITITATHTDTGYSVSYVFTVTVTAASGYSVGSLTSTAMEIYQIVSITNNTPQTASGVMVIVGNLDNPAYVQNRTSVNGDGDAVIEHPQTLLPGAGVQIKVVYTRAYGIQVKQNKFATIAAYLVLTPLQDPPPDTATPSAVQHIWPRSDGSVVIAFETVAGNEYLVQYRDSLAGEWQNAYPCFIATGTVTYWTDSGQPTTHPHPADVPSRFYQILSFPNDK